jgi:hypothetical protein
MNRLALVLVLFGAIGFWATRAGAFDMNSGNAINQDGTERFTDPEDRPMPGL